MKAMLNIKWATPDHRRHRRRPPGGDLTDDFNNAKKETDYRECVLLAYAEEGEWDKEEDENERHEEDRKRCHRRSTPDRTAVELLVS